MGFNFPAAPIVGQIYAPGGAGIPSYKWDGEKWTTQGAPLNKTPVFTDGSTPMTAQLTLFADPVALTDAADKNYVDNTAATGIAGKAVRYDTAQALTAEPQQRQARQNIVAAPFDALGWSGLQINGAFEIGQELAGGTNVNAKYVCDGWRHFFAGSMVLASQGGPLTFFPGFPCLFNTLVQTAQAALGASDYGQVVQFIEGWRVARLNWGTVNAQPITVCFWSAHHRPGVYSIAVANGGSTRSYAATYTQAAADVPQFNTITIPGCPDGTWAKDNTNGLSLQFTMACGATFIAPAANVWNTGNFIAAPGQVNGVAATTDIFRITGVIVLPGIEAPSAARAPFIMRPYDQELLLCQRQLEILSTSSGTINQFLPSGQASAGNFYAVWRFNVKKRALPATAFLGASSWINSVPTAYYALDQVMFYSASWFVGTAGSGMMADARL